MQIKTAEDFRKHLRDGPYADGGYPKYFVCVDGEPMSFRSALENEELIAEAIEENFPLNTWLVIACEINWEDNTLICSHSGEAIESAYVVD